MTVPQTTSKLTRVGPYQLLTELGEGVHLAMTDVSRSLAVIKTLSAELSADSKFREQLSEQVRLVTPLTHPNVAHTFGMHEQQGCLYVAQEYCDGQPWSRIRELLWKRGELPERLHLQVLLEVLSGLQYAHELRDQSQALQSIVHCDASPRHVFVSYDGSVKLVDFGVARAVAEAPDTVTPLTVGELNHLAPELVRHEAVDRRADVFAVGVMLWEAMTGHAFVQIDDASEARRRRSTGTEPRVRVLKSDAPPVLADICDRALALDPEERYATAAELRAALLSYVGEELLDAQRTHLGELVHSAFEQERACLRAIIERHTQSQSLSVPEPAATAVTRMATRTPRTNPVVRPALKRDVDDKVKLREPYRAGLAALRRRPLPVLVIGVGLLSFSITWVVARPDAHETTFAPAPPPGEARMPDVPASTPEDSHRTIAPPEVAQTSVQLTITARPASAVLHLDGIPLSDNPFTARVPQDHQVHVIRASGPRLTSQEHAVTFEHDQAVVLDLQPSVAHPHPAPTRPLRRPQLARSAQASTLPSPSEAPASPRERAGATDLYDTPLRIGKTPRAIYEDDPYDPQ